MTVRPRVSVCAVRNRADVDAVIDGGADAVGVLVGVGHTADDAIGTELAADLLGAVPPYVSRYAVTHLTGSDELCRLVAALPIDTLQLHDEVEVDVVRAVAAAHPGLRIVKAVHVPGPTADTVADTVAVAETETGAEAEADRWASVVDALVLDSLDRNGDRIGGTGRTHDWDLAASIVEYSPRPVVLAGGLTPDNVAEAVRRVRPWGVNVNTGVERDGFKDAGLVAAFVARATAAANGE